MSKLSNERVRAILAAAFESDAAEKANFPTPCKGVLRFGGLTCPELVAMAQEILDLRTANALLNTVLDQREDELKCARRDAERDLRGVGGRL